MSIDPRNVLKIPYQDYATHRAKQIIATLSPERQQLLAEQIQARVAIMGETVANKELYDEFFKKFNSVKDKQNGTTKDS